MIASKAVNSIVADNAQNVTLLQCGPKMTCGSGETGLRIMEIGPPAPPIFSATHASMGRKVDVVHVARVFDLQCTSHSCMPLGCEVHYMRKVHEGRRAVTVYMSGKEYAALVKQSGGNVSGHIRKLVFDDILMDKVMKTIPTKDFTAHVDQAFETISNICTCGHAKNKHHGFGSACQVDNCRCGEFSYPGVARQTP